MDCHCVKLCLVAFIVVFMAHQCGCLTGQVRKTPEQLVLPRVTCSPRRIRAVFGPLVKSNIHVKGKIEFFAAMYVQQLRWMVRMVGKRFRGIMRSFRFKISPNICAGSINTVLSFVDLLDMTGATVPVPHSEGSCGVRLSREKNQSLSLHSRYDSCFAQIEVKQGVIAINLNCLIHLLNMKLHTRMEDNALE